MFKRAADKNNDGGPTMSEETRAARALDVVRASAAKHALNVARETKEFFTRMTGSPFGELALRSETQTPTPTKGILKVSGSYEQKRRPASVLTFGEDMVIEIPAREDYSDNVRKTAALKEEEDDEEE